MGFFFTSRTRANNKMTGNPTTASVLALMGCFVCLGALTSAGDASAERPPIVGSPSADVIPFDISVQELGQALDEYSRLTGLAVLVDDRYTRRPASEVRGQYTAFEGLRLLLAGTGLAARRPDAHSIVVYAPAGAVLPTPAARLELVAVADIPGARVHGADFGSYVSRVQDALRRALCNSPQTRPGAYRLALQLHVSAHGVVDQFHLLDTTGQPARDEAIVRVVRGMDVGGPPVPSMPQPISILVLPEGPQSEADCWGRVLAASQVH